MRTYRRVNAQHAPHVTLVVYSWELLRFAQHANVVAWCSYSNYFGNIFSIDGTKGGLEFNRSGYGLIVTSAQSSAVVLTAKGAASQTGDLQQWQNSAGTVLSKITTNYSYLYYLINSAFFSAYNCISYSTC